MPVNRRHAAAVAVLVAGLGAQPALAGQDDRLELSVGAGYLAHQYGGGYDSPSVVGDLGVSLWLNEHCYGTAYASYLPALGVSALVGAMLDASRHETIYEASGDRRVTVTPTVSRGGLSPRASVEW